MWLSIRCCFSSVFYSRCFSFGIFTARQGPAAIMRIRPVCQAVCGCTYHVSHRPSCSFSFSFGCNISFSFSQRLVAFNSWLLLSPKWCTNESGDSSNQRANGKRNTLVCYDFSSENLEEESRSQTKTTGVRMCVCMQLLIGWMDGWMEKRESLGWYKPKLTESWNQSSKATCCGEFSIFRQRPFLFVLSAFPFCSWMYANQLWKFRTTYNHDQQHHHHHHRHYDHDGNYHYPRHRQK